MPQWFGPDGVTTRSLRADVRIGGKFQWDVTDPDGEDMTAHGEYREVVPDRKIVFTWQWDDDENWVNRVSIVTVEFADADGGTEVFLTHKQIPTEQSRNNHNDGWNRALNSLENFCTR